MTQEAKGVAGNERDALLRVAPEPLTPLLVCIGWTPALLQDDDVGIEVVQHGGFREAVTAIDVPCDEPHSFGSASYSVSSAASRRAVLAHHAPTHAPRAANDNTVEAIA